MADLLRRVRAGGSTSPTLLKVRQYTLTIDASHQVTMQTRPGLGDKVSVAGEFRVVVATVEEPEMQVVLSASQGSRGCPATHIILALN